MFIGVDIGNTNTTFGILKDGQVCEVFKVDTAYLKSQKKMSAIIKKKIPSHLLKGRKFQSAYICSVVPALNKSVKSVLKSVFGMDALLVGKDVIVPIINKYRLLHQVGQDRLVNAYAGLKLFGGGLVIVDFGTAITFDVLSKKREYLGGLIVPGFKLMQESLHRGTALLPHVALSRPIELIGRDTISSIRAGLVYGVASLCDGIITRLLGKECKGYEVVVTGGDVELIKPFTALVPKIEEHLILKGLFFLYQSQKNTR
ncbi:MAG: type III pantothenate kinase [Candidatus Omnitrophota bacterium]